jgi:hypothetical protein
MAQMFYDPRTRTFRARTPYQLRTAQVLQSRGGFFRRSTVINAIPPSSVHTIVSGGRRVSTRGVGGASPEYGETLVTVALLPFTFGGSALVRGSLKGTELATNTAAFFGRQVTKKVTMNITKGKAGGILGTTGAMIGAAGIAFGLLFGGQKQTSSITQTPTQTPTQTGGSQALRQLLEQWQANRKISSQDTTTNYNVPGSYNTFGNVAPSTYQSDSQSGSQAQAPEQSQVQTSSQDTGATSEQSQNSNWILIAVAALAAIMLMQGDKK